MKWNRNSLSGKNSSSSASKYLAQQLQRELVPALGLHDRGIKENSFFVLTKSEIPAALVEMAFLTNPKEEALLLEASMQKEIAGALLRGLEAYFQKFR
ncbi:MAG: N-acetylmuramoyl-L-alanine amidase family protein [Dethiobacteria bacterium]